MNYHISDRMKSLRPSAIREILKYASDPEVISFAAGDPAPESLPVDAINDIVQVVLKNNPMRALLYSQSEGYPPLREEIHRLLNQHYCIDVPKENVIVTSGAQQAIELAAKAVCNDGDTIICENPSFIGALNAFRSYKINLVGVEIEDDGISTEKLEEALKSNPNTRFLYLIPNFQNPTGITMSLEKRKLVYELAKKYEVLILEDNPYGDLRFMGEPVPSIKSMDSENIVIYAGSFSKILSSGMRVGFAVAPTEILSKMTVGKQCEDVHTSMIPQLICYEFLKNYDLDAHIEKIKGIYKEKATLMLDMIKKEFPKEITFTTPEGGLFIWCRMPEGFDSAKFAEELVRNKKVCVVPGSAFLAETEEKSNCFRLGYSSASKESIKRGIAVVGEHLKEILSK